MPQTDRRRTAAPRRILAALVLSLLALMGATSTAAAAPAAPAAGFAAQARALGLTPGQAERLQARVDGYLASTGGTQIAADRIALPGGELRLALPGEQRTGDASLVGIPCPYTWVCAYSDPNYQGDALMLFTCGRLTPVSWGGTGSWINNQRAELRVKFYNSDKNVGWTSPGGYSSDPNAPWGWVYWLNPC
ncbi:hypothetical protein GCM10009639_21200 [Kitasatospora putterlickiae]|uniref:Peptidase inhibitor family I36 n=1 Tax=Kitasatospora putterlickiae TaxID=221725 RepID=A0ABN1XY47_9ACTN